jgi:hypothetical protein
MTASVRDRVAKLVADDAAVNGIDFVELASADQTRLRVHFFNHVALSGTLAADDPVTITGGETIAAVRVTSLAWSLDVQQRPLLEIQVPAPGDFSSYTLRIRSTKLDRFYDRVAFSFKALCPSNIDCETPSHVCPPPAVDVPPIDYLAKDFLSFRKALLDFSALRYPEWQERSEADFGVTFLEALCAVADDLSYLQDRVAGEATLETATQRRSIVRHARLVDYEPRPAVSSRILLQFEVAADGAIAAGVAVAAQGADGTRIDFESGTSLLDPVSYAVRTGWNRAAKIAPYLWDDSQRCLEPGATELWVAGHGHGFVAGMQLLLDTRAVLDADPPVREVVTLTAVSEESDALFGNDVTQLVWRAEDAVRREHDLGIGEDGEPRTLIVGNLVPATQGRRVVETFAVADGAARVTPAGAIRYLYTLGAAPLAWLPDGTAFRPEIDVQQDPSPRRAWSFVRQLLAADAADAAYTVEPFRLRPLGRSSDGTTAFDFDGDGGETLRFGDGTFGAAPPDDARFVVIYRVGDGARGNVAADAVRWIEPGAPPIVAGVTNPFAATDGADAESDESVRRLAPQAFRATQYRAVTPADYAAAAETLPWVSKAGSSFRWTGSWLTVFTTADPRASEGLGASRRAELVALLDRYRLAGYEAYASAPRYASFDLVVVLCAQPDAFRGDVERGAAIALDTQHFFPPDRFTFGTPLERSALEAAVQRVPGVSGIHSALIRRRGFTATFDEMPQTVVVGGSEIVRVDNDPSRPESGSIRIRVEGGK